MEPFFSAFGVDFWSISGSVFGSETSFGTLLEDVEASWICLGENWRQDAPQDRQDEVFMRFWLIFGPHMGGTNVWVLEHFVGLGASWGQDGPGTPQERFQDRF